MRAPLLGPFTVLLAAVAVVGGSVQAAAQSVPLPDATPIPMWGTNGEVRALARVGDTLFVGGTFDIVGPATGGLVLLSAADASLVATTSGIGTVGAIVSDGAGGWYAAQSADSAANLPASIFHVRDDGSKDPAWVAPTFAYNHSDGYVLDVIPAGGRVYVTGIFDVVNGVPRAYAVALDATTGTVLPWELTSRTGTPATFYPYAAAAAGRVYFTMNKDIVAVDAATGSSLAFQPQRLPQYDFNFLSASSFGIVSLALGCEPTQTAVGLCAFDHTGHLRWTREVTGMYGAHWAFGDRLYLEEAGRLVALDAATGAQLPFTLPLGLQIGDIADDGTQVFLSGADDQYRQVIGALDRTTGRMLGWTRAMDGVGPIDVQNGRVALGGTLRTAGGLRRRNLVALDLRTGRPVGAPPDASGWVTGLATYGDVVFAAVPHVEVFAFSATTGTRLPWSLSVSGWVAALAVSGQTLYIGGSFAAIGGEPRGGLAAVDLTTGQLLPWDPRPGMDVTQLVAGGSTLYVAGNVSPKRAAAFETATGGRLPFDPPPWFALSPGPSMLPPDSPLAVAGGRVLTAGRAGGTPLRYGIGWLDSRDGSIVDHTVLPFRSTIAAGLGDLAVVGGFDDETSDTLRLTAVHAPTGRQLAWDPHLRYTNAFTGVNTGLRAVLTQPDLIAVGGSFEIAAGQEVANVAVFRMPQNDAPGNLVRSVEGSAITLGWRGGAAPPNTAFVVEAGTSPGGIDLGRFAVGGLTTVSGSLAAGTYYMRVRGTGASGDSAPSSEVITTLPGTATPPGAANGLSATVAGNVVTFRWTAAHGNATTYTLDVGSATGLTNLLSLPTGTLDTSLTAVAPPGTYYVRVRATNAFGSGGASNEVRVVVP